MCIEKESVSRGKVHLFFACSFFFSVFYLVCSCVGYASAIFLSSYFLLCRDKVFEVMTTFEQDTWVWMPHDEDMALPAKVIDSRLDGCVALSTTLFSSTS